MKASELPPALFDVHRAVDEGLQLWGMRANSAASTEDLNWCKESFPSWEQSIILPFVCPPHSGILWRTPEVKEGYVRSFHDLQFENYNIETDSIKAHGFVVFAYSSAGDYFVIDRNSGSALDVMWIYFPDVVLNEVSRNKVIGPGWTLRNVYQEIYRQPRWYRNDLPVAERMKYEE